MIIITKRKYMIVGCRGCMLSLPNSSLILNTEPIELVISFKVIIDQHPSWDDHINSVCLKGRKLLGFLYRNFYKSISASRFKSLYIISYVRPHFEYASVVWDPHLVKHKNQLEPVQKFACKLCLNVWNIDYDSMLSELCLQPGGVT